VIICKESHPKPIEINGSNSLIPMALGPGPGG